MPRSTAQTPAQYLESLPADKRAVIAAARKLVNQYIPKGYQETCLRFKSLDDLELAAVGKVIASFAPDAWIAVMEKSRRRS
jgi:hypothetical protein